MQDDQQFDVHVTYRFAPIPEWVLYHPDLEPIDIKVFGILDRFAGADRDCYPSHDAIAERCHVSSNTVRRALKRLSDAKVISIAHRTMSGRKTSNSYRLAGDYPLDMVPSVGSRPPTHGGYVPPTGGQSEGKTKEGEKTPMLISDEREGQKTASDQEFLAFWSRFPRKIGKTTAQKTWKRLSKGDKRAALEALDAHISFWAGKDAQFIPHPSTWLNNRRWEDELDARAVKRAVAQASLDIDDEEGWYRPQ